MLREVVAMNTAPDLHGRQVAPESLQPVADRINAGPCPRLTIEHDTSIPPLGKVLSARVATRQDGHRELIVVEEVFRDPVAITLPDGRPGFLARSASDRRPFNSHEPVRVTTISIDSVNFSSRDEREEFLHFLRQSSAEPFETIASLRQSYIPDPELVITVAEIAAAGIVGKRLVETAARVLEEKLRQDLATLYDLVKAAILGFAARAIPKNRPITYVLALPGKPCIELVAVTRSAELLLTALSPQRLAEVNECALNLHSSLPASTIQFLLDDHGAWRFNYLLCTNGDVVGTDAARKRQQRRLHLLRAEKDDSTVSE